MVNESRLHHTLFQQTKQFNLLCSAMDIIDDIIFALRSYANHQHDDQGLAYLEIFGVLQSLCVQQDAVRELFKIINGSSVDLENVYPDIKTVRDARIRVAGHPVGGLASSHFLVRHTVTKWGFELWKFDQAGTHTTEIVNLLELIRKNSLALNGALNDIITSIKTEDRKHKEKFVGTSLGELFKVSSYFCEKMHDGISRERALGLVGVRSIRDLVQKFRKALDDRSDHFKDADFVRHDIPNLEYAIAKFERYMCEEESYNERDALIVATFIRVELRGLEEIAKEIDADYRV
jgi:hypothetical protein